MAVTVADLKDQSGICTPHPILYCRCCGGEYSANKGDYFSLPPTFPFFCCDEPMVLVTKSITYEEVG